MANPSEKEVKALAENLAHLSNKRSGVYRMSWWNERLLAWSLARPRFKAQLFRLVDVFPATSSDADVLRHVEEYLGGDADVPAALRSAIELATKVPLGARVTASQARRNIARMADQFILGTTAEEAVKGARDIWNVGSATTVDLLGEKTVSEHEADTYAARVVELLDALTTSTPSWRSQPLLDTDDLGPLPRASISVKPTAMASRYKPLTRAEGIEQAKTRLRSILRRAKLQDALVWVDMEHHEVKDLTISLFKELMDESEFADFNAGIVMQAYLRETYEDLAELIAWSSRRSTPISVRLVKGAYWDTETIVAKAHDWPIPVFHRKPESDANYERCTRLLLDHHGEVRPAFASHNLRSLAYAISYARSKGLPDNAFEIQMLYGMAEPMHEAIRKSGLRLRVYAPVGELVPGMAYLVRRLLENTSNDSFVRMRFAEGRELDELLAAPKVDHLPESPELARRADTDADSPSSYEPEPLAEWHRPEPRKEMAGAVAAKAEVPYVHAVIDGNKIKTEATIESVNPSAPDTTVAVSASCGVDHVHSAIDGAWKAWESWSKWNAKDRSAVLFRAGAWLRQRKFELSALQVHEAGKPWADADGDVCEAIDFCEYYGREMLRIDAGGVVQSPPGESNRLTYQSRGVGVVIAPWNFPLAIPLGMVAAGLVTGNAVVFKPSEQTPAIASKIVEAFEAAGLPPGVLQFLPGIGEDIGPALVSHPKVAFVAFTGSKQVGLSIVENAAKHQPGQRHIKKVIAELGGKNPMIVDTDADLDQVVPAVLYSAFGFAGQKCSALSRLIVLESVRDHLIGRLVGALAGLRVGNPVDMAVDVGPVIDADAHERIKEVIDTAGQWGTVAAQQSNIPSTGYFVSPTIVTDVDRNSPLARNEIFGPVLSTFTAKDLDEALGIANDSEYALTAGLFSRSPVNIEKVANSIRGANIYVNRQITGAVVGRQPFGGYGMSGVGTKAGGPDYLLHYMEPRVVTENTVRQGFAELE